MESPEYSLGENQIERWLAETGAGRGCASLSPRGLATGANRAATFETRVLSTGSRPATLPIPGGDHPGSLGGAER